MIRPAAFVDAVSGQRPFFAGVPDSLLKHLGTHLEATLPPTQHVIAANEGAAVGLAIGHHLRTADVPVVYLQNSGVGNAVNPLLSLADAEVYAIPMVLVIGWRGRPGVKDEPQHVKQGRVMERLLDAMEIPWFLLPSDEAAALEVAAKARETAVTSGSPVAILVAAGSFSAPDVALEAAPADDLPSREAAVIALADAVGDDAAVISTTGMLGRELFEHREAHPRPTPRDFLCVGGMGHAAAIAQGVAIADAGTEVWTFDGDGALLMHQGTLAVIAKSGCRNLFHAVLNNGVHDSVGGQPTAISQVDVPALAMASGYRGGASVQSVEQIAAAVHEARRVGGPYLLEIRVRPGNRDGIGRPTRTPRESKDAFMAALAEGRQTP